jgi:SIR2-like domain
LHDDVVQESLVVFLGAGSTTERKMHGPGFYKLIADKASYPVKLPEPSFPKLMQYFCDELDGGHHNRLIREAISYLEVFCLPGEERTFATSVSRSLIEIPYLNRFVTTNWDPFIERSLDVLVPIIEDRDLAFWDDKKKQVLKIHGCITRPYSIVATETDYRECVGRNPLIFNKLKDLMATKTFLFMGYSMRDEDFQEVWSTITQALGKFAKLAYAIDPNATEENIKFWKARGIQIFKTYDVVFLKYLRERLEQEELIPSRKFLEALQKQRKHLVSVHIRLRQDSDGGMASSMYQDGLLHALDDILSATILGMKRNQDFESELADAAKEIRKMKAKGDFVEIAYWSGHYEILRRYCSRDISSIPAYFHPDKLVPVAKFVKGRKG